MICVVDTQVPQAASLGTLAPNISLFRLETHVRVRRPTPYEKMKGFLRSIEEFTNRGHKKENKSKKRKNIRNGNVRCIVGRGIFEEKAEQFETFLISVYESIEFPPKDRPNFHKFIDGISVNGST